MTPELIQKTSHFFQQTFGYPSEIMVLSPGRINLIGEHIDYNDGFVLPAAIDKYICFAFAKNKTNSSNIFAIDLAESCVINHNEAIEKSDLVWTNYFRGVLQQLKNKGFETSGIDLVFSSSIPVGSGLSSSAALECGFLFGLNELFGFQIPKVEMALMGQKAEHWVGINCGIMDQFSSVMGKKNQVIKLDCRSLDFEYHPAEFSGYSLVLFDSNVKHSLFSSAYNKRREECDEGLAAIKNQFPEIQSFRDCTNVHLTAIKDKISADVYKRCHYVINEIKRVILACEALDKGDCITLGQLMFDTHKGLSEDYAVSCGELDWIVSFLKQEAAVVGSRLMGGGFGGCTINLIKKEEVEKIKTKIVPLYQAQFGIELKIYEVAISDGTSLYTAK